MRAKFNPNKISINWEKSPLVNSDEFCFDQYSGSIDIDWDVEMDKGSAWARLQFDIKTNNISLEGDYEDFRFYNDEEMDFSEQSAKGMFLINIEIPNKEISVGEIRDFGAFHLIDMELDLSISEAQIELLKQGKEITIQANEARFTFQDA